MLKNSPKIYILKMIFFKVGLQFFKDLFIYFLLAMLVFLQCNGLSLSFRGGGATLLRVLGFSLQWLLSLPSTGSRRVGFRNCVW